MRTLVTVLITLAALAVLGFAYILTGWYNIAANDPHYSATVWLLNLAMDRSVDYHADSIKAPAALQDSSDLHQGAHDYHHMCRGCHGAPGVKPSQVGKGLYPQPPDLAKDISDLSPEQIFWIVKNGIKMTGMPAFGLTNENQKLWAVTAFTANLAKINPGMYQVLTVESQAVEESQQLENSP